MEVGNYYLTKLKVAVLAGGVGQERDVSLESGTCVAEALKAAGLDVVFADICPEDLTILDDRSIDVFFVALHGRFGEDGQLQQILEDKSVVYTGSGPAASRMAFDKMAGKKNFAKAGVKVPAAIQVNAGNIVQLEKLLNGFDNGYVIKPLRQGSSVGVSIVTEHSGAAEAVQKCFQRFGDCMIEEFIPGREVTVGILCGQALPIIEIRPKRRFYDYHAKYADNQTEFLFDTIEDSALAEKINEAALACFNSLGCRHFARVDFRLDNNAVPYVLELNNIPGFTTRSDLPKAAARVGISMSDLCVKIIEAALKEK